MMGVRSFDSKYSGFEKSLVLALILVAGLA